MALEDTIKKLVRTLESQNKESGGAAAVEDKRDAQRAAKKQIS